MPGELEALFVEHHSTIRRLAGAVARRNGLDREEIEDWISWLLVRFVEDEYAVLHKFRGESSLPTYLSVVIATQFRDYRVHRWGRWRPSSAALRKGELAVRLETLVKRDGMSLTHAGELLRTRGATPLSDRDLAGILADLPERGPLRPVEVGPAELDAVEGDPGPDCSLLAAEAEDEVGHAEQVSLELLSTLSQEDQVIIRLRFWEGLSIADVARALGLQQKPLYRRVERVLDELRRQLEARGISREELRDVLENARV